MTIMIRRATREDVPAMVAMLADDALGGPRECIFDPLPGSYYAGFDAVRATPNILLMVAQDESDDVVGCFQLCFLPGISSQGATRALIEDVRVATRCRGQRIGDQMLNWAMDEARRRDCKVFELLTHETRIDAQRFYKRLGFVASHVGMTLRF